MGICLHSGSKTGLQSPLNYIIWGAKGHGMVVRDALDSYGCHLLAVFDNNTDLEPPFPDVPLFYLREGFEGWLSSLDAPSPLGFVVAMGGARGKDRLRTADYLTLFGLQPVSFIHPWTSVCSNVIIGDGVQIMAGACISTRVRIGDQTIVNHMANVDHECILGKGVHIAPGATLAGCVTVRDHVMIGAGATVLPNLTIEEDVIVGAGAVVTKDVDAGSVVAGVPARRK
jgi:sugar O-acyltransferase (sialic acid O-acetyltransferase NeuD family)